MRIKKKKPIFNKSRDHFALRLVAAGFSLRKGLWIMYAFSIFLAISSIMIAFSPNMTGMVILAIVIMVFVVIGKKAGMVKIDD
jgi:hypothetical protein